MAVSFSNPLPILQGWDEGSASFNTTSHGTDGEANRLAFPFLYADIDQPPVLTSSAESLRTKALEAIRHHYQWEHDFNPLCALKLANNWSDAWSATDLDSPFLFLAAYSPKVVIGFYALLRDLTLLKDADEGFPRWESYNGFYGSHYAAVLLEKMVLIRFPNNGKWMTTFRSWNGEKDPTRLQCMLDGFRTRLDKAERRWASLKEMLGALEKEVHLQYMGRLRHSLEATFNFFRDEVQECNDTIARLEMEEAKKLSLVSEKDTFNNPSVSSAIDSASMNPNERSQAAQGLPSSRRKLRKRPPTAPYRRGGSRRRPGAATEEPKLWRSLGLSLVTGLVVISLPFIVIATLLCEAADTVPMYDSNFYSTLSQQLLGFGGLYAIMKPKLVQWLTDFGLLTYEGDPPGGIKTNWPVIFNCLVGTAFLTLLASSPIYPYYPQSSIPLGAVAAICANLATLLIIEDTGNQIVQQSEMIEGLEGELEGYRRRG
ncbi:uncharacterized protein ColSpa_09461 [Colletotrichum spaethianum]|uniref:Uncharacterized protein n=1 Tax=Colletotrichum spaethianum TaxID=700344 RepID=A0AA37PBM7_9PEZI|nr:uncharacterized protein ColSpa_09461 [Colletotrichum spaethianum]GKT49280.1 hypothetical protein ColSpa_09461 [Colletotrichum spaethianum]